MTPPSPSCFPRASRSHHLLLLAADDFPALEPGERATLLDPDDVVHVVFVGLVVGVVFLGAAHRLLHYRMGEAAFDPHHHGLVLLVANDDALQHALRHLSPTPTWLARARSASAGLSRPGRASAPRWS